MQSKFDKALNSINLRTALLWLTAAGGLSLTYVTGLVSYVGLDVAQLFSATSLIDAVSSLVLYGFFASIITIALSSTFRVLSSTIDRFSSMFFKRLNIPPAWSHYTMLSVQVLEGCVFVVVSSYIASILLSSFIGSLIASILFPILLGLAIFTAIRGPIQALKSTTFSL